MSALAMILTATMAVPADGPKKVSMEIVRELDLSGEWKGTLKYNDTNILKVKLKERQEGEERGLACYLRGNHGDRLYLAHLSRITDEGHGKFRLRSTWMGRDLLGIYGQDQDRIILCYRNADAGRPTSFYFGDGQELLTLHRVKSRK